jgi:hypothetical protein
MAAWLKTGMVLVCATLIAGGLAWWSLVNIGPDTVATAFLVNWIVMSWVAVCGQVVPVFLPEGYSRPRAFERSGRIYEIAGVKAFKALVRRGPLRMLSPTLRLPREPTPEDLQRFAGQSRKAEAGHVITFGLVVLLSIGALLAGWLWSALWGSIFGALLNGYPVMLQRYNRAHAPSPGPAGSQAAHARSPHAR